MKRFINALKYDKKVLLFHNKVTFKGAFLYDKMSLKGFRPTHLVLGLGMKVSMQLKFEFYKFL